LLLSLQVLLLTTQSANHQQGLLLLLLSLPGHAELGWWQVLTQGLGAFYQQHLPASCHQLRLLLQPPHHQQQLCRQQHQHLLPLLPGPAYLLLPVV
jgi:hypothetical protein